MLRVVILLHPGTSTFQVCGGVAVQVMHPSP
jgi:hypothetical protein